MSDPWDWGREDVLLQSDRLQIFRHLCLGHYLGQCGIPPIFLPPPAGRANRSALKRNAVHQHKGIVRKVDTDWVNRYHLGGVPAA